MGEEKELTPDEKQENLQAEEGAGDTPPEGTTVPAEDDLAGETLDEDSAAGIEMPTSPHVEEQPPAEPAPQGQQVDSASADAEDAAAIEEARRSVRSSARDVESERLRGNVSVVKWADIENVISQMVREGGKGAQAKMAEQFELEKQQLKDQLAQARLAQSETSSDLESRIEEQKKLLDEKIAENEELSGKLDSLGADRESGQKALDDKDEEIRALRAEIEELEEKLKRGGGGIDEEIARRTELEKQVEQQQAQLDALQQDLSKEFDLQGKVRELELEKVKLTEHVTKLEAGLDFFAFEYEFDVEAFKKAVEDARAKADGPLSNTLERMGAQGEHNAKEWNELLEKVYTGEGDFYNVAALIRLAGRNRALVEGVELVRTALGA